MSIPTNKPIFSNQIEVDLNEFDYVWKKMQFSKKIKKNFIKELLVQIIVAYKESLITRKIEIDRREILTYQTIIPYLAYEHYFRTSHLSDEKRIKMQNSIEYKNKIINEVINKMILNEHVLSFGITSLTTRLSPDIVNLRIFCTMLLSLLKAFDPYNVTNKRDIICSLVQKAVSTIGAILDNIGNGYSTEGYAIWRSLHELECTIIVLLKDEGDLYMKYVDHIEYARLDYKEDENYDELRIKALTIMKQFKCNNLLEFINLGWLLNVDVLKGKKLSFKNSLSYLSGQNYRYRFYKDASRILHASAVHITVDRTDYYQDCILQTYISFFQLEDHFVQFIEKEYGDIPPVQNYMRHRKGYLIAAIDIFEVLKEKTGIEIIEVDETLQ